MSLKDIDAKILSLANNLAEQQLKESQKSFSSKVQQFEAEQYAKGMWNSSITGNRLLELFEEEFKGRTLIIWEAYKDCLKAAQIILTENVASGVKQAICNLVDKTSLDLVSIFQKASRPISMANANASKSIDEIKNYALRFGFNKIDLVILESCVPTNNITPHQRGNMGEETLPTQQKRAMQSNKVQNLRNSITNTQETTTRKLEKDRKGMITVKAADVKGTIDFGIITMRDDEHRAVLERFPTVGLIKEGERSYALSEISIGDSDDKYRIAIVRIFNEGGEGEAQNASHAMISDLDPTWLLLVGIAGGVLSDDFTLGDVLIANRLVDFCVGAESLTGVSFDVRGGPMHPNIQDYIYNLAVVERQFKDWNTEEAVTYKQPSINVSDGNFYESLGEDAGFNEEYKAKVRKSLLRHFGDPPSFRFPKFAVVTNASSDRVIKDSRVIKLWQTTARKVQSIEMELGGVYIAARKKNREYPILAIRGISDIVGFERDDNWTKYACNTAASLAYFLLKYTRPIEPKLKTETHPQ